MEGILPDNSKELIALVDDDRNIYEMNVDSGNNISNN